MEARHLYLIIIFCVPLLLPAQNNKKTAENLSVNESSYFLADISYMNDAVFMGRRDSIAAPYILPSLSYFDTSGFFADASLSYLIGSEENRVDLFLGSAGYLNVGERLSGGISGTAYFFNGDSYNVKSNVLADITGMLSYDLKALEITLMASTYFSEGDSPDIFAGLMLDHSIYSTDQKFLINPTVSLYAGSQYFYQEYYRTSRLGNRQGQGQGGSGTDPSTTNIAIEDVSRFNILNIELSLPVQYYADHLIFSFSPVFAIPQSSATIITTDAVLEEDLESTFYFSVGISYWFAANPKK